MDICGDGGNCLFYACISKLQNCLTFTIEQASNVRNYLMDYLHSMVPIFIRFTMRHATHHFLMPILPCKVCALSIKFACVFFQ